MVVDGSSCSSRSIWLRPEADGGATGDIDDTALDHVVIVTYWNSFAEHEASHADQAFKQKSWLVKKPDGSVDIANTSGAGTPLTGADTPLFTIDVWEHAYYIDYRNQRPKFVEQLLLNLANWDFAEQNFSS